MRRHCIAPHLKVQTVLKLRHRCSNSTRSNRQAVQFHENAYKHAEFEIEEIRQVRCTPYISAGVCEVRIQRSAHQATPSDLQGTT